MGKNRMRVKEKLSDLDFGANSYNPIPDILKSLNPYFFSIEKYGS